ncbi:MULTISPECIES: LeuA family protein [Halocynthiibacter]|uniref:Homocitrate synthase n=1 Tax=Halocynthiibacter halioticoli TaxID=2986804 RepID=A0AAE3IZ98_9RHOB|nr:MULTISPECIES: 2-isopropylmalate synthase [Halocynthiibacter]MCV6824830.1 2-isopropylmalate synthase [Halocynthiibacter halioticoli]MCW4057831.1 2-isopropylmalate synthase [Halocynthiibacter sp. SDUM655004]
MRETHFEEGKWWVSPYNFEPEVRSELNLAEKVEIHDATLRDGEQTPGVVFSIDDKIAIASKLDELGVDRIEAGMPAVSADDQQAIKEISKLGLKSKIFTFARAMKTDIDLALECGADGVVIEVPIGYPKLVTQFGWTWEDVAKKTAPIINYARENGLQTLFFPYDTTRARKEDLTNLCNYIMDNAPPDSMGIVDTMGCATPEAIKYMVRWVKDMTGLPIEIHTHNDFGMGVATELAAVSAGASCVHSCANGLGERTGNAALEELMMGLHLLYGYDTQYKLDKIPELAALISEKSNVPIAQNKPVLGRGNFIRESGIGINLVMNDPLVMFATHPALTGKKGEVVLGKKSGKASIIYKMSELGLGELDDDKIATILAEVKKAGIAKRNVLSDEEFANIVATVKAK